MSINLKLNSFDWMNVPSWCFCARAKFLSKNSLVYSCAGEQTHWGRWRLLLMGSCPQGFVTLFDCEWFLISARDPPASPRPTRTRETRKTRNASAESSCCACKQSLFCFRTRLLVKGKKNDSAVRVACPCESHAT